MSDPQVQRLKLALAQMQAELKRQRVERPAVFSAESPDLVAGSMYGIRAFNLGPTPDRLRPLSGSGVGDWKPGWNGAMCPARFADEKLARELHALRGLMGMSPWSHAPVPASVAVGCSCGFHAFTDATRMDAEVSQSTAGQVSGIVEGAGRTVVAQFGFRSERARVKALVLPRRRASFWNRFWLGLDVVLVALNLFFFLSAAGGWWNLVAAVVCGLAGALNLRRAWQHGLPRRRVRKLAKAFGVPVFGSRAAAVAAFPLGMVEPGRKAG